jgi:signal transduction histidine kinase
MVSRVEASEAERRRLLADVSHELRTPLSIVQGNLEALIDGVYPADEAHVRPILEETRVLARLVEDLGTLSLAEAGALSLHREPTDVAALARETAGSFRPQALAAGISIETHADADVVADLDPVRIREVLANLVANAVRYARTRVGVALSTEGDRFSIAVSDDGPGIDAAVLPHVFERFSKSSESRGAGLGLAIAKSLVTAHGGEIGAESAPGQGTTMRFTLPRGA